MSVIKLSYSLLVNWQMNKICCTELSVHALIMTNMQKAVQHCMVVYKFNTGVPSVETKCNVRKCSIVHGIGKCSNLIFYFSVWYNSGPIRG